MSARQYMVYRIECDDCGEQEDSDSPFLECPHCHAEVEDES